MPEKTSYAHGQISWVDLATCDMKAAGDFYHSVFGWNAADQKIPGGLPYAEFQLEGKPVGGLGRLSDEMQAQGVPPSWNTYINVDDIEAVTAKVEPLGGKITVPAMKIVEAGWLAFIQDPTGGNIGLWQKNQHAGARVINEPGSLCWSELATRDIERAREFYGQLVDWDFDVQLGAPTRYYIVRARDRPNGGLMQMNDEWGDTPPHWAVYFCVADTDATVARAEQAGGTVRVLPFDTPVGRVATLIDPQGAVFSLIALAAPRT